MEGLVERLRDGERRVELVLRAADPDALAGREPVELEDARRPGDRQRPRRRHASGLHYLLGKCLRALDLRGRRARAEDGDAAMAQLVGEPGDERRLGADDDEVDPELAGERDDRGVVVCAGRMAVGEARDSRVARSGVQL